MRFIRGHTRKSVRQLQVPTPPVRGPSRFIADMDSLDFARPCHHEFRLDRTCIHCGYTLTPEQALMPPPVSAGPCLHDTMIIDMLNQTRTCRDCGYTETRTQTVEGAVSSWRQATAIIRQPPTQATPVRCSLCHDVRTLRFNEYISWRGQNWVTDQVPADPLNLRTSHCFCTRCNREIQVAA